MRYLSKSRFKLALKCMTSLYYNKRSGYADISIDDPFLQALIKGGFQVGELAKYYFSDDPVQEGITIESLDPEVALKETWKRLEADQVIIAEAAFDFKSFLVRADIIDKNGDIIKLYEVKAKSFGENDSFLTKSGNISSEWIPYLYDVAFQKYVIKNSLNKNIHAYLMLVDKTKVSSVQGLNQKFKILKNPNGSVKIKTEDSISRSSLGESILTAFNVDDVIEQIWSEPVPNNFKKDITFEEFVNLCAYNYENDIQQFVPLSSVCKKCQYVNSTPELKELKSGFFECWKETTKYDATTLSDNLVIDLWGGRAGSRSLLQELIDNKIFLIKDVDENIIKPKTEAIKQAGLTPHLRRMEQVSRVKRRDNTSYFDKGGFWNEVATWEYPLHMIDFETSISALPYHKGLHPYESIAFQFSHHILEKNGKVFHAGQYISFEPGVFPNYSFLLELKKQLETDNGTIFRYHTHENTILRHIYDQLELDDNAPENKEELKAFINHITSLGSGKKKIVGRRNMVDLYEIVLKYYYSPYSKGNNSIKKILPAIIHESEYLKDKYSKPIYGKTKAIVSLNFDEHIWITEEFCNDPYKTLPKLFQEYDTEMLDELFTGFEEVTDGGTAMTAYNYLQYSEIPENQRVDLKNGLLRYCELDTMAMIMILEGFLAK